MFIRGESKSRLVRGLHAQQPLLRITIVKNLISKREQLDVDRQRITLMKRTMEADHLYRGKKGDRDEQRSREEGR